MVAVGGEIRAESPHPNNAKNNDGEQRRGYGEGEEVREVCE
jgi:hypothetical protein